MGWRCGVHPSWHAIKTCKQLQRSSYRLKKRKEQLATTGSSVLPALNINIITELRDPVERIVSEYNHCRRGNFTTCWHEYSFNEPPSLEQFVMHEGNDRPFQNRQTKMTSGCPRSQTNWNDTQIARKCLEQAKANVLEKFFFVGIHEEFDKSLQLLSEKLGEVLKPPTSDAHSTWAGNETKYSKYSNTNTIDDNLRAKIVQKEVYDMELYQFAKYLFHDRYSHVKNAKTQ